MLKATQKLTSLLYLSDQIPFMTPSPPTPKLVLPLHKQGSNLDVHARGPGEDEALSLVEADVVLSNIGFDSKLTDAFLVGNLNENTMILAQFHKEVSFSDGKCNFQGRFQIIFGR